VTGTLVGPAKPELFCPLLRSTNCGWIKTRFFSGFAFQRCCPPHDAASSRYALIGCLLKFPAWPFSPEPVKDKMTAFPPPPPSIALFPFFFLTAGSRADSIPAQQWCMTLSPPPLRTFQKGCGYRRSFPTPYPSFKLVFFLRKPVACGHVSFTRGVVRVTGLHVSQTSRTGRSGFRFCPGSFFTFRQAMPAPSGIVVFLLPLSLFENHEIHLLPLGSLVALLALWHADNRRSGLPILFNSRWVGTMRWTLTICLLDSALHF